MSHSKSTKRPTHNRRFSAAKLLYIAAPINLSQVINLMALALSGCYLVVLMMVLAGMKLSALFGC